MCGLPLNLVRRRGGSGGFSISDYTISPDVLFVSMRRRGDSEERVRRRCRSVGLETSRRLPEAPKYPPHMESPKVANVQERTLKKMLGLGGGSFWRSWLPLAASGWLLLAAPACSRLVLAAPDWLCVHALFLHA